MNPAQSAGIALALFGVTEFVLRSGQTAKSLKTTTADQKTTPLIFACYAVVLALLVYPWRVGRVLPASAAWLGVVLAFVGLFLRWWAMVVLGRFYTRTLITTETQTVVRRGPYRLVRHPGYAGSLLTWIGAAAASGNALLLVVVAIVLWLVYMRRIAAEEEMLLQSLGVSYAKYRKESWRLVPFVF
jgi:protein-S-isoprenylcysteine O-methyltransferase Ste14